jgi:hypothetical protein
MAYHVLPAFDTASMDTAYDVAWGALRLLSTRNEVSTSLVGCVRSECTCLVVNGCKLLYMQHAR